MGKLSRVLKQLLSTTISLSLISATFPVSLSSAQILAPLGKVAKEVPTSIFTGVLDETKTMSVLDKMFELQFEVEKGFYTKVANALENSGNEAAQKIGKDMRSAINSKSKTVYVEQKKVMLAFLDSWKRTTTVSPTFQLGGAISDLAMKSADFACGYVISVQMANVKRILIRAPGALEHAQRLIDEMNEFIHACRRIEALAFERTKGKGGGEKNAVLAQPKPTPLEQFVKSLTALEARCYRLFIQRTLRYDDFASGTLDGEQLPDAENILELERQIRALESENIRLQDYLERGLTGVEGLKQSAAEWREAASKATNAAQKQKAEAEASKLESDIKEIDRLPERNKQLEKLQETYAKQMRKLVLLREDIVKVIPLCGKKFEIVLEAFDATHQMNMDDAESLLGEGWREKYDHILNPKKPAKNKVASVERRPTSFKTAIRETNVCVSTKYTITSGEGMEIFTTSLAGGPATEPVPSDGDKRPFPEAVIDEDIKDIEEGQAFVMVTPSPSAPESGPSSLAQPIEPTAQTTPPSEPTPPTTPPSGPTAPSEPTPPAVQPSEPTPPAEPENEPTPTSGAPQEPTPQDNQGPVAEADPTPSGSPSEPTPNVPPTEGTPPESEPKPQSPTPQAPPQPGDETPPQAGEQTPPQPDEPTSPQSVEREPEGQPQPEPTPPDYGIVKATSQVLQIAMTGGSAGKGQPIEGAQIKLLAEAPPLPDGEAEILTAAFDLPGDIFEDDGFFEDDVASDIADGSGEVEIELAALSIERFANDGSKTPILGLESNPFDDAIDANLASANDTLKYLMGNGTGEDKKHSTKDEEYLSEIAARGQELAESSEPESIVTVGEAIGEGKLQPEGGTAPTDTADDALDQLQEATKADATSDLSHETGAPTGGDLEELAPDELAKKAGRLSPEAISKIGEAVRGGKLPPKGGSKPSGRAVEAKPVPASGSGSGEKSDKPKVQVELPPSEKQPPMVVGFNDLKSFGEFWGLEGGQMPTGGFDPADMPDKIQTLGAPSRTYAIGEKVVAVFENYQEPITEYSSYLATNQHVVFVEEDPCRNKEEMTDPHFEGAGLWGQDFDNQWAIKRVGFNGEDGDAWAQAGDELKPVVVAVIDSGIDWFHPDFSKSNLWFNEDEVPNNGFDDDGNGFIDDTIGWNFIDQDRKPWDYDGHGTFVAGVIAAAHKNGKGIAGINPAAKIMPIKALDAFGNGHASMIAEAVTYAVDNGAQIINLSLGGRKFTQIEQWAIDYAAENNVIVVAASGNKGTNVADYSPAGLNGVITVSATDRNDDFAKFSNWGPAVDIAAPGVDVLSLRARNTDLLADIPDVDYDKGKAIVGENRAYLRASGTSFAAPIVTGTASLLLSKNPELTAAQVTRMLLNSSKDIDQNGIDNFTGYGLLDAQAALQSDPDYYIDARISGVKLVQVQGQQAIQIFGTVDANDLNFGQISVGKGENPEKWATVKTKITEQRINGSLIALPAKIFGSSPKWTIRLVVEDKSGNRRQAQFTLSFG